MNFDKNKPTDEEIQKYLAQTSQQSINKIIHDTESIVNQAQVNDMKITKKEVEDFLAGIFSPLHIYSN